LNSNKRVRPHRAGYAENRARELAKRKKIGIKSVIVKGFQMIDIGRVIVETLPKDLLLDLDDRSAAEALKAQEVIRTNYAFSAKRTRESVGQIRFRAQEQGFEEVVQKHGGTILTDGLMLGTDLKIFQPFARFSGPSVGVILGFASMPEPRVVPPKNKSRGAGVLLNIHLQPQFDFDGAGPQATDIFVLFLVARDRQNVGLIEEVAVGVIGADYKDYIFYQSLEVLLKNYQVPPAMPKTPPTGGDGPKIALRKHRKPFVPPEKQDPAKDVGDGTTD
jgi:hypothetical protein